MRLHRLFQNQSEIDLGGLPDLEIKALTADSRQVRPGTLFIAVRGEAADGHHFIQDAVSRGAVTLLGEQPDPGLNIPYIQVTDSRAKLAQIAAVWHGSPAQKLVMIGVTGTDGKTTTVNLLYHILQEAGIRAGMITTVNAVIGDHEMDTGLHVTTPGPLEIQAYLSQMAKAGITHCILEATSHGLAQRRVDACEFDLAVITNITHEHLDYHGSFEAYRQAKGRLFSGLKDSAVKEGGPIKAAILNRADSSYEFLRSRTSVRQVTFGVSEGPDVLADEIVSDLKGLRFIVAGPGYRLPVRSPLIGGYNVTNCLAAFTAAVEGLNISPDNAINGIAALKGVPGRMEIVDVGQLFTAIVDFAHTPNALRRALETARRLTNGKVIAIFGSAGLRDREKRRLMAEVSVELADLSILTAEDPRTESLELILEEMAVGIRTAGGEEGVTFWRIPDRGEALRFAVRQAQTGDLIISCGKGHEQSMCFGEEEYPWDDRVAFQAALSELLEVDGPQMPMLPTSQGSFTNGEMGTGE